jgi:hypothetical protein
MFTMGGSNYNSATGVFTVPPAGCGLYNINVNVNLTATTVTNLITQLLVNGSPIQIAYNTTAAGLTETAHLSINYPLSDGSAVSVTVTPDTTTSSVVVAGTNISLFLAYTD